jgi:hypothetical protein
MQIKQMEEEKERLNDKVQKAAAQAAGERCRLISWFKLGVISASSCCGRDARC